MSSPSEAGKGVNLSDGLREFEEEFESVLGVNKCPFADQFNCVAHFTRMGPREVRKKRKLYAKVCISCFNREKCP